MHLPHENPGHWVGFLLPFLFNLPGICRARVCAHPGLRPQLWSASHGVSAQYTHLQGLPLHGPDGQVGKGLERQGSACSHMSTQL